jgi:ribosomal-protein-alanine N-acetyltransferase
MESFPEMTTERLRLRRIRGSDLESVFAGLSNPDVIKYYGVQFDSLDSTREQLRWFEEIYENKSGVWWAISPVGRDLFYGAIGLNDISQAHRKGEIGYWLLPPYWGNGYVSEVIPAVLDYAFNNLHLHRVEAFVEPGNAPSNKLLARFGFTHEGTMRDCQVKNGAFISLEIHAILSNDIDH